MGKSQRVKGAVFERELAHRFSEFFGREFKRNIGQARDGGNDLDVGLLVVEAKRRASLKTLRDWMQQAQEAATSRLARALTAGKAAGGYDHIPVVVMREDGEAEPLVLLQLADFLNLVDLTVRNSFDK
jgi:hypothetical protein